MLKHLEPDGADCTKWVVGGGICDCLHIKRSQTQICMGAGGIAVDQTTHSDGRLYGGVPCARTRWSGGGGRSLTDASPFLAAIIEPIMSGTDVPTASTRVPITIGVTPKMHAAPVASSTYKEGRE